MERAMSSVDSIADRNIAKAIKNGDLNTSRWYKEKTDERYKTKPTQINMQQETDQSNGTTAQ
jgi:hypothetical protein